MRLYCISRPALADSVRHLVSSTITINCAARFHSMAVLASRALWILPAGLRQTTPLPCKPDNGINFGGVWQLANGGANSLPYVDSLNLTPTGTDAQGTYTFSFTLADIGLTAGQSFELFGMQVSDTGYSSPEALGGTLTGSSGWGGTQTEVGYETYTTTPVPEPSHFGDLWFVRHGGVAGRSQTEVASKVVLHMFGSPAQAGLLVWEYPPGVKIIELKSERSESSNPTFEQRWQRQSMKLIFQLRFHTKPGQSLWLTGDHEIFGQGRAERAIPLQYLNPELWQAAIHLPAGIAPDDGISYRYLLRNADDSVVEDWDDKRINPAFFRHDEMLVIDSWNAAGFLKTPFIPSHSNRCC